MIETQGDKRIPSIVLLLSDGNTDMPTEEELRASLDQKAESVQRAREAGVRIFSICLNADGSADTSEMRQIAEATGGEFREVTRAEDLRDVFGFFYDLIYGTSAVPILNDTFTDAGSLETEFVVPGIGVEEINVLIYGKATSCEIMAPDGSAATYDTVESRTFTMLKLTDVVPGTYQLVTQGVPGDAIRIDLVFNADLEVDAALEPKVGPVNPQDPITCTAYLATAGEQATNASQYEGYEAVLQVLDVFDEPVETVPMVVEDDHFEVQHRLAEGSYRFVVHVSGNGLGQSSAPLGPINVSASAMTEAERANTPPTPVVDPLEVQVAIWPFADNTYTLDLTTLATDAQDDALQYKVISSSFLDSDYTVDADNTLTVSNYSVSRGAFTVRAADSYGQSCDVEVVITSYNVGMITLIGIGVAAVVGIIVAALLLRAALRRPFRGDVTVESTSDGRSTMPKTITGRRGRLKLRGFDLEPTGLDYDKSYFQATGDRYVLLRTNIPVTYHGVQTKEVRIESGVRSLVDVSPGKQLTIRFDSRMSAQAPHGARPGGRGGFGGGGRPRGSARASGGGRRP